MVDIFEPSYTSPEFADAKEKAKEVRENYVASGMETLNSLDQVVGDMTFASRFDPEKVIEEGNIIMGGSESEALDMGLSVPEALRARYLRRITLLKTELAMVGGKVEDLVMQILADSTENE